jgi:hypothetical protein
MLIKTQYINKNVNKDSNSSQQRSGTHHGQQKQVQLLEPIIHFQSLHRNRMLNSILYDGTSIEEKVIKNYNNAINEKWVFLVCFHFLHFLKGKSKTPWSCFGFIVFKN